MVQNLHHAFCILEWFPLFVDLLDDFFVVGVLAYFNRAGNGDYVNAVEDSDFVWV